MSNLSSQQGTVVLSIFSSVQISEWFRSSFNSLQLQLKHYFPPEFPSPHHFLAMAYKRFFAVVLLALSLIAANAAPVPESIAPSPSPVDTPAQFNLGNAINTELNKAANIFRISTTAVIAICIGCAAAVILLVCCCVCCCCSCFK